MPKIIPKFFPCRLHVLYLSLYVHIYEIIFGIADYSYNYNIVELTNNKFMTNIKELFFQPKILDFVLIPGIDLGRKTKNTRNPEPELQGLVNMLELQLCDYLKLFSTLYDLIK